MFTLVGYVGIVVLRRSVVHSCCPVPVSHLSVACAAPAGVPRARRRPVMTPCDVSRASRREFLLLLSRYSESTDVLYWQLVQPVNYC